MLSGFGKLNNLIQTLQEKTKTMTVTVEVGDGAVRLVMNGHQEVVEMALNQSLLEPCEAALITELVVYAFNEALQQSRQMVKEEVAKATGGINLPFLPGLF
ncbi:MAG: YbaB/EbfC family nucleoid-associated protein [Bacillota bacterium]|jgi:DNA-binding YbaB/EbfC family protein